MCVQYRRWLAVMIVILHVSANSTCGTYSGKLRNIYEIGQIIVRHCFHIITQALYNYNRLSRCEGHMQYTHIVDLWFEGVPDLDVTLHVTDV